MPAFLYFLRRQNGIAARRREGSTTASFSTLCSECSSSAAFPFPSMAEARPVQLPLLTCLIKFSDGLGRGSFAQKKVPELIWPHAG